MALHVVLQNDEELVASSKGATIFYDGDCGLCHYSISWVVKRDKKNKFHYKNINELQKKITYRNQALDSVILYEEGKYYIKGNALIQILRGVGKTKLAFCLSLCPRAFRDFIYYLISKGRKIFFRSPQLCSINYNEK